MTTDLSVGLSVLQNIEDIAGRLLRPGTTDPLPCLALSMARDVALVDAERHDLLLSNDVLEILLSTSEGHASDSGSSLDGVLLVRSQNPTVRKFAMNDTKTRTKRIPHTTTQEKTTNC